MPDGTAASLVYTLLWVVFAAAGALSAILGLLLAYHWVRFSMQSVVPFIAIVTYSSGCVFFLFIMFVAAFTF